MNKAFRFKNLDCADCAEIDGINSISVNFIFQKMIVDFDETRKDEIFAKMKKTINDFEPDMVVMGL